MSTASGNPSISISLLTDATDQGELATNLKREAARVRKQLSRENKKKESSPGT
jgi:hypothetical protein